MSNNIYGAILVAEQLTSVSVTITFQIIYFKKINTCRSGLKRQICFWWWSLEFPTMISYAREQNVWPLWLLMVKVASLQWDLMLARASVYKQSNGSINVSITFSNTFYLDKMVICSVCWSDMQINIYGSPHQLWPLGLFSSLCFSLSNKILAQLKKKYL